MAVEGEPKMTAHLQQQWGDSGNSFAMASRHSCTWKSKDGPATPPGAKTLSPEAVPLEGVKTFT